MRGTKHLLFCGLVPCLVFSQFSVAVVWADPAGPATSDPVRAPVPTPTPVGADPQAMYNVKAAFLYSFGRYMQWPAACFEATQGNFVIGVLGEDPFGGALDQLARIKQVQGRRLVIERFATLAARKPCQVLFVPRTTPEEQQQAALRAFRGQAVLLVGETPGFAERGGTVNFYLDQDTVRFELNLIAARQQGLSVDAKLQNLARLLKTP